MSENYRRLRKDEIEKLRTQGCYAENWENVRVADLFTPQSLFYVRFYGEVLLGTFDKELETGNGVKRKAGIYDAELRNVSVGDNCLIEHIGSYIADYKIEPECYISQVGVMEMSGETSFGNGTEIYVLKETGGEANMILHEGLTAQEAYLMLTAPHDVGQILKKLVRKEVKTSVTGYIGTHAKVVRVQEIRNVWIGEGAKVENASLLSDTYLDSCMEAPVRIGVGCIIRSSIVCSDAEVLDGAKVTNCFVGEATHLGLGFSATDSLFFANCYMDNGEACSVVAGPFTVSHHKSTLLIGCMLSFANLGSATNMSNHLYKMGPVHYGVMRHGCKTASGGHLVWPSYLGAFSMVMGKLDVHVDTRSFPFSYIICQEGKIYLVPGANAMTVGTFRDCNKWPQRDKRHPNRRSDLISSYSLFTPDMMLDMYSGYKILIRIRDNESDKELNQFSYGGMIITRKALEKGIEVYERLLNLLWAECYFKYAFQSLAKGEMPLAPDEEVHESPFCADDWINALGLSTSIVKWNELMEMMMEERDTMTLVQLHSMFDKLNAEFESELFQWMFQIGVGIGTQRAIMQYEENLHYYFYYLMNDCNKEKGFKDVPYELIRRIETQIRDMNSRKIKRSRSILSLIKNKPQE